LLPQLLPQVQLFKQPQVPQQVPQPHQLPVPPRVLAHQEESNKNEEVLNRSIKRYY
jgi:hypothetical protein